MNNPLAKNFSDKLQFTINRLQAVLPFQTFLNMIKVFGLVNQEQSLVLKTKNPLTFDSRDDFLVLLRFFSFISLHFP